MKILTVVIGMFVIVWGLVISLVGVFLCNPIKKAWEPAIPGQCFDLIKFYYGLQIPNIVTDIIIVILPIPVIWNLFILEKKSRLGLIAMFSVGGL